MIGLMDPGNWKPLGEWRVHKSGVPVIRPWPRS